MMTVALRLERSCLHLKVEYRRPRAEGGGLDSPQKAARNRTGASGDPLEMECPGTPTFCSAAAKENAAWFLSMGLIG